MSVTHIVGVDPGLVHTGVVSMVFDSTNRTIQVDHEAVVGPDATAVTLWAMGRRTKKVQPYWVKPDIFIEGYRPRSHFTSDKRMVEAVSNMRAASKGRVLDNTGVKKVIRQKLMELLGVWKFSTVTNHQDLRSAARIALLGMAKDDALNQLLADIVRDHLNGQSWTVKS